VAEGKRGQKPGRLNFVGEEVMVRTADARSDEFDEESCLWYGGDGDLFPNLELSG
jgi:hypothetical protein